MKRGTVIEPIRSGVGGDSESSLSRACGLYRSSLPERWAAPAVALLTAGDANRIVARFGSAWPPGTVPAGAFVGEAFDATLFHAVLRPTRNAGQVALFLSTTSLGGIILRFAGLRGFSTRFDRRRRCRGGVSGCNAGFEHTARSAAGLALFVE